MIDLIGILDVWPVDAWCRLYFMTMKLSATCNFFKGRMGKKIVWNDYVAEAVMYLRIDWILRGEKLVKSFSDE